MKKALAILLVALALLGCETEGGLLFTYAAQGTEIQAERLVAQFLGKPSKPIPYGGMDIDRPIKRMQGRWPQLKAELDRGSIGLTEEGGVAIRDASPSTELKALARAENHDRGTFYRGLGVAVGHGAEVESHWLAYTEDVFGKEWLKQAPAGWWLRSADGQWKRK